MRKITLILVLVSLGLGSMAQAQPGNYIFWSNPAQTTGDTSASEASTSAAAEESTESPSKMKRVIGQALDLIGIRYRYGSDHPSRGGLDCSGLVKYVFQRSLNVGLPHNAYAMSKLGQTVNRTDLKPGDLVFFNTLSRSFSHVGIYVGDGKFIHAPSTGKTVQVVNLNDKYWQKHYQGARRIVDDPEAEAE